MYKIYASFIGVIIAVMVSFNGVLAGKIGNTLTLPMIHISGFITVSLLLVFIKEQSKGKVPIYLNTGGLVGVLLIILNNLSFGVLGASLTLALGVLGQTLGSLLADSTGFLGMKKYDFDKRKIWGLSLLLLGIIVMTESWRGDLLYIFYAFCAGLLVVLSMIINSQLSIRVGIFHSAWRNYLAGLCGSLLFLFISGIPQKEVFASIPDISPVFLAGGGILGVFAVAGSNKILPKIPVVYTTLLLFTGQVGAGMVIDYLVRDEFSIRKLMGAFVILLGLFINMEIDKRTIIVSPDHI
jgi:transporter family-2 protein